MVSLRNMPMKRKLRLVIMVTSTLALLLACSAFVVHDSIALRRHMVSELASEADVLAVRAVSLLNGDDPKPAEEVLAGVRDDLDIVCAAVYGADGKLFGSYQRPGRKAFGPPSTAQAKGHRFWSSHLIANSKVVRDQQHVGSVYLESDLQAVRSLLTHHLIIASIVVLTASALTLLLTGRLQRLVTDPFLKLTNLAQAVTQQKDYTARAPKSSDDEVGKLIDAFNEMLEQIQERDKALRKANDDLEKRVQERTQLLQRELFERMKTEENLWESQRTLSTLMSNLPGAAYRCRNDLERTMEFISEGSHELTGYRPADLIQNAACCYAQLIHPEDQKRAWQETQAAVEAKRPFKLIYRIIAANTQEKWVWEQGMGVFSDDGKLLALEGFISDMTDRKRAEEERKRAEEQLRQAQKMEAVGRLAGGVAHDFNNVLTVITGYCDMLLRRTDDSDPLHKNVDEIGKAATRAASLTRQLLAFSRKQVLQPKVLELNEVVAGMQKMLRRLIGEDVEFRTSFADSLGLVKTDPGQIEQVILNLAVNARDAMPQGGTLTIETGNVTIDQASIGQKREITPGEYVMLAVTDTGVGMTEAVRAHLFEPFFTTKGLGKGTGLGLATSYGIVRQSGGYIEVYSEPDHGSTFKIFLPRVDEALPVQSPEPKDDALPQGKETLLMVEDEVAVRELSALILRECGYTVLEAGNGIEGLQVAQADREGKIDLVISDIIMPQLGGQEMVARLQKRTPDVKVLFTSGYTDDALVNHGVLDRRVAFLEKPFSPKQLAIKVREVLDQPTTVAV